MCSWRSPKPKQSGLFRVRVCARAPRGSQKSRCCLDWGVLRVGAMCDLQGRSTGGTRAVESVTVGCCLSGWVYNVAAPCSRITPSFSRDALLLRGRVLCARCAEPARSRRSSGGQPAASGIGAYVLGCRFRNTPANHLPSPCVSGENGPCVVGVGGQALAEHDPRGWVGWVGWTVVCKGCVLSTEDTLGVATGWVRRRRRRNPAGSGALTSAVPICCAWGRVAGPRAEGPAGVPRRRGLAAGPRGPCPAPGGPSLRGRAAVSAGVAPRLAQVLR